MPEHSFYTGDNSSRNSEVNDIEEDLDGTHSIMSDMTSLLDPRLSSANIFGGLRQRRTSNISPEQALIHLVKVMLGTGMLSLPMAFKYSGLWLGLFLLVFICGVCIYCTRQLVNCANFLCSKQLVNVNIIVGQFGFCSVYFVFMADNLKQFFDENTNLQISQAWWIALLVVPLLGLCSIRELRVLVPLAFVANLIYLLAVATITTYLFTNLRPSSSLPAVGSMENLPLFFGTVLFAFEGVAVILPIENQMSEPQHFISRNVVLNTGCLLVLAIYCTIGFYGYLCFGNDVLDTLTLNMPKQHFYEAIKLMLVGCIFVSYPLQFYVPMERIEKWISRKIVPEKQKCFTYTARYTFVIMTCILAELIPHLSLFISLIGAFAGASLALIFPPVIELLCKYSRQKLTREIWIKNIALIGFGFVGGLTGTYVSLLQILAAFGKEGKT